MTLEGDGGGVKEGRRERRGVIDRMGLSTIIAREAYYLHKGTPLYLTFEAEDL